MTPGGAAAVAVGRLLGGTPGYSGPPPVTPGRLLAGVASPWPWVLCAATAACYALGVRRLRHRGARWAPGRGVAFGAGLLVVGYALGGGLARYDDVLFSAHMAQHMLLAMVAPVLLALGAPVTLALRTAPAPARRVLLAALHSRVSRWFTQPLLPLALIVGTPFVIYFTGLYPLSLRNGAVHALLHLHFLASGCLFFWAVLGVDPIPHRPPHWARLLALLAALPFHAFLGLAIMQATTPLADAYYTALGRPWGDSLLGDQRTGGGLLWASGDLIGLAVACTVLAQWMRADERTAVRVDRALDRAEDARARRSTATAPEAAAPLATAPLATAPLATAPRAPGAAAADDARGAAHPAAAAARHAEEDDAATALVAAEDAYNARLAALAARSAGRR